jgi:colanic acid biosynthesis glycosyl transferase WcaI
MVLQYPPDINASGQLMAQLCRGLSEEGHRITVITSFPHYEQFRVLPAYRKRLYSRNREGGVDVIRLFAYARGDKSMKHRLINYLVFNLLALMTAVLLRAHWDALLCVNGSFFTGLTGWLIGKIKGSPFVYNVQDLYPDVPIRAGQLRNPVAISILKRLEVFMYRKAAHITVISAAMKANLLAKGVSPNILSIIPNFTDPRFIRLLPKRNDFSRRHGLCEKFVVMHAGNLGYVYDLHTLLGAASLLSNYPDIVVAIIGNGVMKAELQQRAEALQLKNILFLPFQLYETLPWLRASADVHVSLYQSGAAGESFPSKIYEIMASGRPMILGVEARSELERLVTETGSGLRVKPGDSAELAEAILRLYRDPDLREQMGKSSRAYAEKNCSLHSAVAAYDELFRKIDDSCSTLPLAAPLQNYR